MHVWRNTQGQDSHRLHAGKTQSTIGGVRLLPTKRQVPCVEEDGVVLELSRLALVTPRWVGRVIEDEPNVPRVAVVVAAILQHQRVHTRVNTVQ